jgi:hypothetical protein
MIVFRILLIPDALNGDREAVKAMMEWTDSGKTNSRSLPTIASLQRKNVTKVAGFQFEIFRNRWDVLQVRRT